MYTNRPLLFSIFIFSFIGLFFSSCAEEKEVEPPAELLLPVEALAEYEKNIDHALLINKWKDDRGVYRLGQKIYNNTCFACHGDESQNGSIPSSAKFWQDSLKHGNDPYAMYETITRGFGLMPPQVQLVPQEKYAVIHFIREFFMKEQNPDQYTEVDENYLATLPAGTIEGPAPGTYRPWAEMDYGNFLIKTYDVLDSTKTPHKVSGGRAPLPNEDFRDVNFAYKGIAIRLNEGEGGVAEGNAFMMFDHDLLRVAGAWTGEGFIDYQDILMNERHNIFVRTKGDLHMELPVGPGWANPETGDFKDSRFVAVDGRPFGPLPREWAHYKGLYYHGDRVVISYTVGEAQVLETCDLEQSTPKAIFSRTLNISPSPVPLKMRVAPKGVQVALMGESASLKEENGMMMLNIPPNKTVKAKLLISRDANIMSFSQSAKEPEDLSIYTQGGPAHYPQKIKTPVILGEEKEAYTADVLTLPLVNPWRARVRPSGIDFIPNTDEAVVCTIDGDVWIISNITAKSDSLSWQRIASGLFQPLGIKYQNDEIYVTCRDQLVLLKDLNGDRETDFYQSFNSDHQVTEHFHEFAMGLQTDENGNFYYAKSGRHARTSLVPQHGTLLRVSADGSKTDILANGFRAANGVCLNPDGTFIVTDQEGYWNPMNRINWVEEGGFYGNMWGYDPPNDTSDAAMEQPLCWIDQKFDRSPAELLWADSKKWGPLNDQLLSLSYGYGKIFAVLHETVDGIRQGGMVQLPLEDFPTGIIRGRFQPDDGQLYLCGMTAWATSQVLQAGGLYRIRYTGKALNIPVTLHARKREVEMSFANELDKSSAENIENYTIKTWDLKRTRRYGSDRYNAKELNISSIKLDGKTLRIQIPEIAPTWVMEISYSLKDASGKSFEGVVQNTIYELGVEQLSHN